MIRLATVLVSFLLCGCGLIERAACGEPCEGGIIPAAGEPADFTLAGHEDDRASISDAELCPEEDDVFVATVETMGEDDELEVGTWLFDRLVPELSARGLNVSRGLGSCVHDDRESTSGIRIGTHDWADLDPIAQTVVDVAAEDDVAVRIVVAVEPEILFLRRRRLRFLSENFGGLRHIGGMTSNHLRRLLCALVIATGCDEPEDTGTPPSLDAFTLDAADVVAGYAVDPSGHARAHRPGGRRHRSRADPARAIGRRSDDGHPDRRHRRQRPRPPSACRSPCSHRTPAPTR